MTTKKISLTSEIKELKETNKKQYDLIVAQNSEIVKLIKNISTLQTILNLENREAVSTIYVPPRVQ